MNTRLALGITLIAAVAAVLFIALRGRTRRPSTEPSAAGAEQPIGRRGAGDVGRPAPAAAAAPEAADEPVLEPDPPGVLRLEGQVIDGDEAPVGGATVTVTSHPPRTTTTEADGSFAFDRLLPRRYTLVAIADRGASGPTTAHLTETSPPVIMRLEAGTRVEVAVVAASNKSPIAGATVELRPWIAAPTTTGKDGVARFGHVPLGQHEVVAWAPGYGRAHAALFAIERASTQHIRIELGRGTVISGRVIDSAGNSVVGARVLYECAGDWMQTADEQRDAVRTDAKGRFRTPTLPIGTYRLHARHAEHAPGLSDPIALDGTHDRDGVVIEMKPGAALAGVVVDTAGKPVAAATVRVGIPLGDYFTTRQGSADDTGRFAITGLPRRVVQVAALHESASSRQYEVDLAAGTGRAELEIVLDVGGRIAGVVVDPEGEPVEGAQVSARPRERNRAGYALRGPQIELSDAVGRFELRGLEPGRYALTASPPTVIDRGLEWNRPTVDAEVGDTDVRILLEADGGVRGKVAFADGSAPALFTVHLGYARFHAQPFASDDGSFHLADMPPHTYRITVQGPEFEARQMTGVVIEAGRDTDLGTITVRKGKTVSGRVVDEVGHPVGGATVSCGAVLIGTGLTTDVGGTGPPIGGIPKQATTEDAGEFTLRGVGVISQPLVAAHASAGRSLPVTLPATDQSIAGIELVLVRFGALEGRVARGGDPLGDANVIAQSKVAPMTIQMVVSSADGRFRFDRMAPDRYFVSAGHPFTGLHSASVTVEPGQTAQLTIEVERGEVTLAITPVADSGPVPSSIVFRATGALVAANARQIFEGISRIERGSWALAPSMAGLPAKFQGIEPGEHTACVVPFAEMGSPNELLDKLTLHGEQTPAFCRTLPVAPSPAEQGHEIRVSLATEDPPKE